jgi:hypothetical protein
MMRQTPPKNHGIRPDFSSDWLERRIGTGKIDEKLAEAPVLILELGSWYSRSPSANNGITIPHSQFRIVIFGDCVVLSVMTRPLHHR